MQEEKLDPAKTASVAQQLVKLLGPLDSPTRQRAVSAAMVLLGDAPLPAENLGRGEKGAGLAHAKGGGTPDPEDTAAFFNRDEALKPSDNAYLSAAYHYAQYGPVAFSLQELRGIATEAGVVLPDRVDMTLRQAGKGGKKLFQSAGKDAYRPTATGCMYFKERFGVTAGRKSKPAGEKRS